VASIFRVEEITLVMEATRSSETSDYHKPAQRHIQEDGILQITDLFVVTLVEISFLRNIRSPTLG
jgi:hypothetical protein